MSIAASIEAPPVMPGSHAATARLSKRERRQAARRNPFETLPDAAFHEPILKLGGLIGGGWLISDPAGIKQVMLDKVANYPKSAMERRFFRALFGDGLLSSDGETWRSHRRIMAPAFDPRSVAGYAAAMAETAQAFGDGWARRDNDARIDISAEMTALTLQIISKTMFSADASEMADLTGDTLHRGQEEAFNFSLLDLLPIIGPIRMRRRD